jgi:hypothetical protein
MPNFVGGAYWLGRVQAAHTKFSLIKLSIRFTTIQPAHGIHSEMRFSQIVEPISFQAVGVSSYKMREELSMAATFGLPIRLMPTR